MKIIDNTDPTTPSATCGYGNLKLGDRFRFPSGCVTYRRVSAGHVNETEWHVCGALYDETPVIRVDADGRDIAPAAPSWEDARPGDVVIQVNGGTFLRRPPGASAILHLSGTEDEDSVAIARIIPAADVTLVLGRVPDEIQILREVIEALRASGHTDVVHGMLAAAVGRANRRSSHQREIGRVG